MNSGGSAPADMGGEPPNGRARGQPVEVYKPPPEETLAWGLQEFRMAAIGNFEAIISNRV
jgi:hypothetical protein